MIVLAVEWRAHEGSEDQVADLFLKMQAVSRQEPGCLMYIVHRNVADQQRFFIYEQYKDDQAVDAHRNSPHFKKYVVDGVHMIATRTVGELYHPLEER